MHWPFLAVAALALAACSQDASAPVDSEVAPSGGTDDATLRQGERSLADPTEEGPARQLTSVPERFRGVWDYVEGSCNPASDLRVEIGENAFGFYESQGQVTDIRAEGADAIVVTLAMGGEGETWTMKRRFTLDDGGRLIPSAVEGEERFEPMPLKRCRK